MVFSKINGASKVFELRRTREELGLLMALLPNDPKSDNFLKRATVNTVENVITHIKFRFDNVLVLPPATPTNPFPTLLAENIGVTAYEQNNGKSVHASVGLNFPIGYQSGYPLGITISIAQNPSKPTVQYAVGSNKPTVQSVTVGTNQYYAVTASLKVSLPIKENWGGASLRYINLYMMVESENHNRIVAQILNRPITSQEASDGLIMVNATSNLVSPTSLDNSSTLFYKEVNELDTVSFAASIDNILAKESALSDLLSYVVTLKSTPPVINFFRSAELLLPSSVSGYNSTVDLPGVRFSFTSNEGSWQYVSLFSKLAGTTDFPRLSQQWSKGADNNDIAKQLAAKGFCEKIWNHKSVQTFATATADSVMGQSLPTFTAFDIYLVFSENSNIATPTTTPWNFSSNLTQVGQLDTSSSTMRPSQSIPSNVVSVITSIYRPQNQTITTSSSYQTAGTVSNLRLNSVFTGETIMPPPHLVPYFSDQQTLQVSIVSTLKAVDFTSINPPNNVIYDGDNDNTLTYAFSNRTFSGGGILPPTFIQDLANTEWDPKWEFTYKNRLMFKLSERTSNVLNNTSTDNNFFPSSSKSTIDGVPYIIFYEFSNVRPIRSRPTAATIKFLPKVFIDTIQESRLLLSSTPNSTSFGATQLAVSLKSVQAYNDGPYSWDRLEIQVSTTTSFDSPILNNVTGSALEAEILYLASNFQLDNLIVAPRNGSEPAQPFLPFVPGQVYNVRLRLRYTWSGSVGGAAADDQFYIVPNNVYQGGLNSLYVSYETSTATNLPLPLVNSLSIVRERPLTLVATVPQPVPTIFLGTDTTASRMVYRSLKFQLVDALNNKVSFTGGLKEVLYNDTSVTGVTPQIANFLIPSNKLDNSYSVIVTATYTDKDGSTKESPPIRSPDLYFEALPNFSNLSFLDQPNFITCIATIDLGVKDDVNVNTNAANPTQGPTLSNSLYVNRAMLLTCLIPALVGTNEQFAHVMTYQAATNTYQTAPLAKIKNSDIYGPKLTFLVTALNNTGLAIAMSPRQQSTLNSIPSSWNIYSSTN